MGDNKLTKAGSRRDVERKRTTTLMALPGAIFYSFFFIVPVSMGVYYSFTDWNSVKRTNNFAGFTNYIKALTNKRFAKSIVFNAQYTVLYVVCVLVLAILIALLLNQKVKGITVFRALYFLPAVFSGVTISLIFQQIFFRVLPAFGQTTGIEFLQTSLLSSKTTAKYAILFVNLWCRLPMMSILVLAGLQTVPDDLIDAAKIDGANNRKVFHYVTVPHLIPTLSIVLVMAVKEGLMIFDLIKVLTDGGPNNATRSLSMLIYSDAFENKKYAFAMAEAIIVGFMIAAISYVQIKISSKDNTQ